MRNSNATAYSCFITQRPLNNNKKNNRSVSNSNLKWEIANTTRNDSSNFSSRKPYGAYPRTFRLTWKNRNYNGTQIQPDYWKTKQEEMNSLHSSFVLNVSTLG